MIKPEIPAAYEFLYEKARYKVAYGGRGKAASWSFARVLVYRVLVEQHRVMCTRDVQNSIEESVYQLLVDQIQSLGYAKFFDITKTHIRSKLSGSVIFFRGLNDKTVDNAKSMEGVTIVWCAEAHKMGKKSWKVLRPTIRAGGSEIWVDYNPDEEEQATHQMFAIKPPNNAIIRHINFDQNPFFPAELEEERQESLRAIAEARDDEEREQAQLDYNNVWLGHCRKISMAAIFGARTHFEDFETPADANFYHGMDFGYSDDPAAVIRCFESPDQTILYIDAEAFGYGVEQDELPQLLDQITTTRKYPIYADSSRPETISHVKARGFDISAAEKGPGSVEDGVSFIKSYKKVVIHKTKCPNMVAEAKNYKWKIDKNTGLPLKIIVDAHNHGWDATRYALWRRIKRIKKGFFG